MRNLKPVPIKNCNLGLTGWELLIPAGISSDERTMVGNGICNGRTEAWVAHLDRPVNAPAAKGKSR